MTESRIEKFHVQKSEDWLGSMPPVRLLTPNRNVRLMRRLSYPSLKLPLSVSCKRSLLNLSCTLEHSQTFLEARTGLGRGCATHITIRLRLYGTLR